IGETLVSQGVMAVYAFNEGDRRMRSVLNLTGDKALWQTLPLSPSDPGYSEGSPGALHEALVQGMRALGSTLDVDAYQITEALGEDVISDGVFDGKGAGGGAIAVGAHSLPADAWNQLSPDPGALTNVLPAGMAEFVVTGPGIAVTTHDDVMI